MTVFYEKVCNPDPQSSLGTKQDSDAMLQATIYLYMLTFFSHTISFSHTMAECHCLQRILLP